MREFTQEEKELIVNTPIDRSCFEIGEPMTGWVGGDKAMFILDQSEDYVFSFLEAIRKEYKLTYREGLFEKLICLLPNSYKVVKL